MKFVVSFVLFSFIIENISGLLLPKIIGGSDADINRYPYQASIRFKDLHFCSGSIISEKHILTVAHCVKNDVPPYDYLTVSTGTGTSNNAGQSHRIIDITLHPDWIDSWDTSLYNDIAVIKITDAIRFDAQQQKIALASQTVISGQNAVLTGWGYTDPNTKVYPIQLQKLQFTLLTSTDCQPFHGLRIRKKQLCADRSMAKGACTGDSGGPLVTDNQLVGIMSWVSNPNCISDLPDVYTNVYAHRDFIECAMNK